MSNTDDFMLPVRFPAQPVGVAAEAAIAGFAVINDVTMRDCQYRSLMWLQGKTWEHSTPFGPYLVAYASTILTLEPGDVIACGTPGGVGHARRPERYLTAGQTLTTEISGLGRSNARAVAEVVA